MRRTFVLIAFIGCALAAAVLESASSRPAYRFAAVFDTAKGMVAGQQVKIAGAVVGQVDDVGLTSRLKARLVLSIDGRFGPFHEDATCQILPEGIISENFVACDPGSSRRPVLPNVGSLPTVPVSHTSVPTSLQDLLNVFAMPTDDRIRVLIGELGIATAGRGEDLNALLRRANPALGQTRRLLAVINQQRSELTDGVGQTDRVLAALARQDGDLRDLVGDAAAVASTVATRHDALAAAVRNLPPMLDAVRPSLASLDRVMTEARPLLATLHVAAPALLSTTRNAPPFASAAARALSKLAPLADTGRRTVRIGSPLISHLRAAAAKAPPFAGRLDELLANIRDRGGIEAILRWVYGLATVTAGYDSTSHILGVMLQPLPQCSNSAPQPACNYKYSAPGQGTIPPNDPACGPQPGAPWDPPTSCTALPAGLAGDGVMHRGRRRAGVTPGRPAGPSAVPQAPPAPRVPVPHVSLPLPLPQVPTPNVGVTQGLRGLLRYLVGL